MLGVVGPLAVFFLRMFKDASTSVNLGMIGDIIRYIICWLGPFFNFGRAVIAFVTVRQILQLKHVFRNVFIRFRKTTLDVQHK